MKKIHSGRKLKLLLIAVLCCVFMTACTPLETTSFEDARRQQVSSKKDDTSADNEDASSGEDKASSEKDDTSVDGSDESKSYVQEKRQKTRERVKNSEGQINKKNEKEYYDILDQFATTEEKESDIGLIGSILLTFYDIYEQIRVWAAPISFVSIIIGIMLGIFSKGNKRMQHFGIFGLAIGVPLVMVFIVYGIGILNDIFLN